MFISYSFDSYLVKGTLIDSDFTEEFYMTASSAWEHIINIYEKRNMDVVRNLMFAFLYWSDGKESKIKQLISFCKEKVPEYKKYEKELVKIKGLKNPIDYNQLKLILKNLKELGYSRFFRFFSDKNCFPKRCANSSKSGIFSR